MKNNEIRELFFTGKISWKEAFELLKKQPKPWQTKAWKERRMQVLGDMCEICGTKDQTLILQHKWHPSTFSQLCEKTKAALRSDYETENPFIKQDIPPFDPSSIPPPEMIKRDSCPKCGSVNIKFRKNSGTWECKYIKNSGFRKYSCAHVFIEPKIVLWSRRSHEELIASALYKHQKQIENAYQDWENAFIKNFYDRICSEALKLSFEESDRYLAMRPEDVSTLCKRCAFKQDAHFIENEKANALFYEKLRLATIQTSLDSQAEKICPSCKSPMVIRTSKNEKYSDNEFWGCSNFPICRITLQKSVPDK